LGARIAAVDLYRNFSTLAAENGWTKPVMVDENVTALRGCVHPVLRFFQSGEEPFVPNNVVVGKSSTLPQTWLEKDGLGEAHGLDPHSACKRDAMVLLVTGPNMAGKSTVMRQLAIAQIMCQMGSYVPAHDAIMGIADRVFTRIGSSDHALKRQSTFMVEMLECANMMRLATERSILLLDELGRGTSTFDGLSLAWAIVEDLHDRVRARTLFSTHYHELLEVAHARPGILPMQMEVIERERKHNYGSGNREILFSRRFVAGAAGKSYGLHVAELAGISPSVVARAADVLEVLGREQRMGEKLKASMRRVGARRAQMDSAVCTIFDLD
jgi:DNA mismatch repair protein MutS